MADIATLAVRIITTGSKQTAKELKQIEKEAERAEMRAIALGTALGKGLYDAARAAAQALNATFKATLDSERSSALLAARIRALGAAGARSVGQIETLANTLQALTTFDDEKIKDAAGALLAFNNIKGDNFDRTLKAALDLAENSGDDLVQVAERLGKALDNPAQAARMLRDVGVTLSKQQQELVKDLLATGKGSEAQSMILAELERRYKGISETARTTLGGSLKGLRNDFNNLLEGDGKGITGVTASINELAATLRSDGVRSGFKTIVDGLFSTAAAAAESAASIGNFVGQYQRFLSTNGFARPGADTSLKDLQTRRTKLLNELREQQGGGLFGGGPDPFAKLFGIDIQRSLNEQLKEVDDAIKAYPFRGVSSVVDSTAFGGRLDGRDLVSTPKTARERTKATKELTDAEKLYNQVMEDNATIDQLVMGFRQDQIAADYDRVTSLEAVRKQIDGQADDMAFELSLMFKTNKEREREIALRYAGAEATEEQRQRIAELSDELYDAREAAAYFGGIKDALGDTFTDFITGAKSAKDAFGDLADYVFQQSARMLADNALKGLFSGFAGGAGGGSSAGSLLDLFSSAAGGFGFADGGYTGPGGKNQVRGIVHAGEVVWSQSDVARAGGVGAVESMRRGGSRAPITINVPVYGRADTRTRDQIASTSARAIRRASRLVG